MAQQHDPNCEDERTRRIYNLLRLWGAAAVIGLSVLLVLFDVIDDMCLGNHFAGVPPWLQGIVGGIFAALFVTIIPNSFKRK